MSVSNASYLEPKNITGSHQLLLIVLSLMAVCSSCNGQNTSQIADRTFNDHNSTIAIGDTVSELDKAIFIIFQDKDNNYWFGSDGQGVYQYDPRLQDGQGKYILHFTTKDGLCNNRIREIQQDKSGNIFFTTLDGISKFDGQKFNTLTVAETNTTDNPWKMLPDDLWFRGEPGKNGPYRYDGKSLYNLEFPKHYMEDEFYKNNPNPPYSPYEVYFIYKDSKGNMWFGTSNFGICRYDARPPACAVSDGNDGVGQAKSLSWMYEEHLTLVEGGGAFGIRSIIEDREGKFWFCNTRYRYDVYPNDSIRNGNHLINYKREKVIDPLKALNGKDMIYYGSIVEDDKGNLWMTTYDKGVWRYDGENMNHYPVKDGGKDITLFSIYKDNLGDLWFGTHEAGAYKFNGKTFEPFRP